jgi:hypothetical protein
MRIKAFIMLVVLVGSISVTYAAKPEVCRGEMYSAESAADPYYKDATWIGKCFFKKSNTQAAKLILEECHYKRPCLVQATILDSGEIIEVNSVKLDGHDMTCRGTLINTDKESGDTAKIGACRFTVDAYTGVTITDKCREGRPCTVRARLLGNNITHVYSVQAGR